MITIKKIIDSDFCEPERHLSPEEKSTVIAGWGDNENYWYFQEVDKNPDSENYSKWAAYQEHLNQPPQETQGSTAFEAFKQCSDEEKRIIAQDLKQFLT